MTSWLTVSVVLLLAASAATPARASGDPFGPFLGVWEYRQENRGTASGYDHEGERIEFSRRGDAVQGLYYGLEREGEHGLFYTLVEVREVSLAADGKISFRVPPRHMFTKRPRTLGEQAPSAGFTSDELTMRGHIENTRLVLHCSSRSATCPDKVMVFRKNGWDQ